MTFAEFVVIWVKYLFFAKWITARLIEHLRFKVESEFLFCFLKIGQPWHLINRDYSIWSSKYVNCPGVTCYMLKSCLLRSSRRSTWQLAWVNYTWQNYCHHMWSCRKVQFTSPHFMLKNFRKRRKRWMRFIMQVVNSCYVTNNSSLNCFLGQAELTKWCVGLK